MQHYSYKDFKKIMCEQHSAGNFYIEGVIVFTQDSFSSEFSLESRSYAVLADNKAFGDYVGYSIFGSALDGSDSCVRLDKYMQEEYGGANGWKVEYCYFPEGNPTKCCVELCTKEQINCDKKSAIFLDANYSGFCFELHRLYKVCLAADTFSEYFGDVMQESKIVVIDVSTLTENFMRTKGVEMLDDLYKIIDTDFAKMHLKIKILYDSYVPEELSAISNHAS